MSANSFPFKRQSDPLLVPVGKGTASIFTYPADFWTSIAKGKDTFSFWITNPNPCWVRFIGSGLAFPPQGIIGREDTGEVVSDDGVTMRPIYRDILGPVYADGTPLVIGADVEGNPADFVLAVDMPTPNGMLLPPGFFGAMTSAQPKYLSAIAVIRGGIAVPATLDALELNYGGGM